MHPPLPDPLPHRGGRGNTPDGSPPPLWGRGWGWGVLLVLLAACTGDGRTPLVVYSPHGPDLLRAFEERFEATHPDVDVQWIDMGSQEVLDRLRSEQSEPAGRRLVRRARGALPDRSRGRAAPAVRPHLGGDAVAEHSDTAGFYHSVYLTPEVIAFNSEVLSAAEAPQDWDDVLDPRWRDEVLIRDPLASGTMRTIFGMILARSIRETGSPDAGWEWLRQLDAQTKEYVLNPTLLYQKLARQEGLVTLWTMPDIELLKATTDYPIDYVFPTSGTPLVVDAVAVVEGTHRTPSWHGSS